MKTDRLLTFLLSIVCWRYTCSECRRSFPQFKVVRDHNGKPVTVEAFVRVHATTGGDGWFCPPCADEFHKSSGPVVYDDNAKVH